MALLQKTFRPGNNRSGAGLPDGLFSNQKSQFEEILEGLRLKNVYLFYGYLEYLMERDIL
jgi:hypothetical protein